MILPNYFYIILFKLLFCFSSHVGVPFSFLCGRWFNVRMKHPPYLALFSHWIQDIKSILIGHQLGFYIPILNFYSRNTSLNL